MQVRLTPLRTQPRSWIHSALARASMRPSAASSAVALRCLRPSAPSAPADDDDRPHRARYGSSSSARMRASRLGRPRRPRAAACSSGSPARPRRSRGASAPSRCGTSAPASSTAPVIAGSVASGPNATPRPSARAGEQTQQQAKFGQRRSGRRATASRASSTVGRYGGSMSSGSAGLGLGDQSVAVVQRRPAVVVALGSSGVPSGTGRRRRHLGRAVDEPGDAAAGVAAVGAVAAGR